jgi:hypothetical protein
MKSKGFLVQWLDGLAKEHFFLLLWIVFALVFAGAILSQLRMGQKRNFRPADPNKPPAPRRNLETKVPPKLARGKSDSGIKK